MSTKNRLPFQNLDARAWQNLGMMALCAFYLVYIGWDLFNHNLFVSLGLDYSTFWSAGRIANSVGYAKAYDLDLLRQIQISLLFGSEKYSKTYSTMPMVFLPIFISPFQLLALLPPGWSYLAWCLLNLILMVLYLRFFSQSVASKPLPKRTLVMLLLAFPVFWNFYWGQVSVLLMICVGEFLRMTIQSKPIQAGFWLGGLLLKPQLLVLIIATLLMQRAWKTLTSFATVTLLLLFVSLRFVGLLGLIKILQSWLGLAHWNPASAAENMANWRMFALHLGAFISPSLSWGLAITGMTLTFLGWLYLSCQHAHASSSEKVIVFLGTLAATLAVTWHSHIHMLMILMPLLIYLYHRGLLPPGTIGLWTFSLTGAVFLGLALTLIIRLIFHAYISGIGALSMGMTGLGFNLYLLAWAIKTLHQTRKPPLLTKT